MWANTVLKTEELDNPGIADQVMFIFPVWMNLLRGELYISLFPQTALL